MPLQQSPESVETLSNSVRLDIRQYHREDCAEVIKIFSKGLMLMDGGQEFRHLWEEFLRRDLTNEMADVKSSHIAPGGSIWVATVDSPAGAARETREATKIVGMVGLVHKAEGVGERIGETLRVFVDPSCHRMGVGRKLMLVFEDWVRKGDSHRLILTTKANVKHTRSFY